jgi:hypothetical protein
VAAIRKLASPDFQVQLPDGRGAALDTYLEGELVAGAVPVVEDLEASSFSNTMVTRYTLRIAAADGAVQAVPCLTVFQRIDGDWRAAGDAIFPPIE